MLLVSHHFFFAFLSPSFFVNAFFFRPVTSTMNYFDAADYCKSLSAGLACPARLAQIRYTDEFAALPGITDSEFWYTDTR